MANVYRAFVISFGVDTGDGYEVGSTTVPAGGTYLLFDQVTGEAINTANDSLIGEYGSSAIADVPFVDATTTDIKQFIIDAVRLQESDPALSVILAF